MMRKILIDRKFAIDNEYDWTLREGELFARLDLDQDHSSISSCNIQSEEDAVDIGAIRELRHNIELKNIEYSKEYNPNHRVM